MTRTVKAYITKSKSGHYTVTIRVNGMWHASITKLSSLARARYEAAEALAQLAR